MLSVFQFVLLFFATFRLMRMLRYDYITSKIRPYFLKEEERELEDGSIEITIEGRGRGVRYHFGEMLGCHWCVSIWSSIILYVGLYNWPHLFTPIVFILAVAAIASMIQVVIDFLHEH